MTTYPSHAIQGTTLATVDAVGNDPQAAEDWDVFESIVRRVARSCDEVHPDRVRHFLTNGSGELVINPRRLSAFYPRAVSQGLLEFSHWGINGDVKGHNAGRPARIYKLKAAA